MNQNKVISTAVLFLLLGITIPAFARRGQEEKVGGGEKAQPPQQQQPPQKAKPQQAKPQQARPQQAKPQQARPQQAKPQQARPQQARPQQARPQQARPRRQAVAPNRGNNGNHYGRIPDDRYRANFGHGHSFRMMRPQLIRGYNRFQYGGYSFGYDRGWPLGWGYDDDFYVEYVDGFYYMYNLRHPGIHITLTLF